MSAPKSMDKWSDKEWAHACSSDSSDDDSEGGGIAPFGHFSINASDLSGAIGVMPHAEAGYRLAACYNPLPLHPF